MALTGARVEALPGHHQPSRPLGQAAVVLWPCTEGAPFHAGRVAESTRQPPPPWGSSHSQPIPEGMAVQMYNPQEHNPRSRTNFRVSEAEDWGGVVLRKSLSSPLTLWVGHAAPHKGLCRCERVKHPGVG